MGAIDKAAIQYERKFDENDFLRFLGERAEDGRWELIDGIPIQIPPATFRHNRIATNLERLLNEALSRGASGLEAMREAGLRHPSVSEFRPVADVAVVDPRQEFDNGQDRFYDGCAFVAEVLSPSTEHYDLIWKRPRYCEMPECLHVMILSQNELRAALWSRGSGWVEHVFSGPDARIDLPEFGFSRALGDLYKGTKLQ